MALADALRTNTSLTTLKWERNYWSFQVLSFTRMIFKGNCGKISTIHNIVEDEVRVSGEMGACMEFHTFCPPWNFSNPNWRKIDMIRWLECSVVAQVPQDSFFAGRMTVLYLKFPYFDELFFCIIVPPLDPWLFGQPLFFALHSFASLHFFSLANSRGEFDDDPVAAQAISAAIGRNRGIECEQQLRRNDPALTRLKWDRGGDLGLKICRTICVQHIWRAVFHTMNRNMISLAVDLFSFSLSLSFL